MKKLKNKIWGLFLIIFLLLLNSLCYSGKGLLSNLSSWGEDQNRYNDIFSELGLFHFILGPNVLKTIVGQENRWFKPGLPQQGGGPAKGLGQIEDETYNYMLETPAIFTLISKYVSNPTWQRLYNN